MPDGTAGMYTYFCVIIGSEFFQRVHQFRSVTATVIGRPEEIRHVFPSAVFRTILVGQL